MQDIADFVGDSLDLSRMAVKVSSQVIVFCGVQFMAETAAILNPGKTVLIPDKNAQCSLADNATVAHLKEISKQHPDAIKLGYINCTDAIKASSDICCTSTNAVHDANSIAGDKILFIPDMNLGSYVAEKTNKEIYPCPEIIAHPECKKDIRYVANYVGSTVQMSTYVTRFVNKEFIVATKDNFTYKLIGSNIKNNCLTQNKRKFNHEKSNINFHSSCINDFNKSFCTKRNRCRGE